MSWIALQSVLIITQQCRVLRWNGILSSWCFRSSFSLEVKLEYWRGSFVLILKSLLFTVQFLRRAVVNINSGIPPLCLEFLCYLSITGRVDVRGSYLVFLSVVIKANPGAPFPVHPSDAGSAAGAGGPSVPQAWGCLWQHELLGPAVWSTPLPLCRHCFMATSKYLPAYLLQGFALLHFPRALGLPWAWASRGTVPVPACSVCLPASPSRINVTPSKNAISECVSLSLTRWSCEVFIPDNLTCPLGFRDRASLGSSGVLFRFLLSPLRPEPALVLLGILNLT